MEAYTKYKVIYEEPIADITFDGGNLNKARMPAFSTSIEHNGILENAIRQEKEITFKLQRNK